LRFASNCENEATEEREARDTRSGLVP